MKLPRPWGSPLVQAGSVLLGLALVAVLGCGSPSTSGAVATSREDAIKLAARGRSLCEQHRYSEAITCLVRAAAANPGDHGQTHDFTENDFTLDQAALQNGERQLTQLLKDRPAMAQALKPGDELWNWTVRKFAGEDTRTFITWDASDPSPQDSDRNLVHAGAWLQLRKSQADQSPEYECDALWSELVFELNSIAIFTSRYFAEVDSSDDEPSQEEFILDWMAAEERAIERSRAFYLRVFAPRRLALGAKQLWPDQWHCFRYFSTPQDREAAWRKGPRWDYYTIAYCMRWRTGNDGRQYPDQPWRRLQALLPHEKDLTVVQRVILHCLLANFYRIEGDRESATAELEIAAGIWPASPMVRDARPYVQNPESGPEPASPREFAARARARFERNDIDRAVRDVRKAIDLDPGDGGEKYASASDESPSPSSLEHGEAQVRAMLSDRPGMATFITPGDELWNWAVRRFAGEATGEPIDWIARDPAPRDSQSSPKLAERHATIQVRELENLGLLTAAEKFNRYWALVVFELYNLSDGMSVAHNLNEQAQKLTRDEFVVAALEHEQLAAQCSRMFFLDQFLPYAQAKGLTVAPASWHCFTFLPPDVGTRQQIYRSLPKWLFYAKYYERLTEQEP